MPRHRRFVDRVLANVGALLPPALLSANAAADAKMPSRAVQCNERSVTEYAGSSCKSVGNGLQACFHRFVTKYCSSQKETERELKGCGEGPICDNCGAQTFPDGSGQYVDIGDINQCTYQPIDANPPGCKEVIVDDDGDGVPSCQDCDDTNKYVGRASSDGDCATEPKSCGGGGAQSAPGTQSTAECCEHTKGPVRPVDGSMYYTPPPDISLRTVTGTPLELRRRYDTRTASGAGGIFEAGRVNSQADVPTGISIGTWGYPYRMIIHASDGSFFALEGPGWLGASVWTPVRGTGTNVSQSYFAVRAWVRAPNELVLSWADGSRYVFDYSQNPADWVGRLFGVKRIEDAGGGIIDIVRDGDNRLVSMRADDGTFIQRRATLEGYAMEYGKGSTVHGAVEYVMTRLPLPSGGETEVLTEVQWPDGRREYLMYTGYAENGVPFSTAVRSDYSGGIVPPIDEDMPAAEYLLLSEVRDTFGVLVERHEYNEAGIVTRTETPGERWAFTYAYDQETNSSTTTGINEISGEERTYRFVGARMVSTSSTCSTCANQDEIRTDSSGRRVAVKDKRGTWTTYEYFGNTPRVRREIQNGNPDAPGTITDASAYRQIEYAWSPQTVVEISGSVEANEKILPSVLQPGGLRYERRNYDPNDLGLVLPHDPMPKHRERQGFTFSDAFGSIGLQRRTERVFYDSANRVTERRFPRSAVGEREVLEYYPDDGTLNAKQLFRRIRYCNGPEQSVGSCILATTYADYNVFGSARTITDPAGVITHRSFSQTGMLTEEATEAGGQRLTTQYHYDRGRLHSVRDHAGIYSLYGYVPADQEGQGLVRSIVRSLSPDGADLIDRVEYSYWPSHLKKDEARFSGSSATPERLVRYQYGVDGRLERIFKFRMDAATPDAVRDQFFNRAGDVVAETDENHAALDVRDIGHANARYDLDALGRVAAVRRKVGESEAVTRYTYDTDDNLRSVTDADGRVTQYTFDDFQQLVQVDSPDSGTTRYTYDLSGNVTGKVDATGSQTRYTYDAMNRLVHTDRIELTSGQTMLETYEYDSCRPGALCRVADTAGETRYTYDALGHLTNEVRVEDPAVFETAYAYDELGRLNHIRYPSGRLVFYRYSAAQPSRVSAIETLLWGTMRAIVADVVYDAAGAIVGYTLGNGQYVARVHDLAGEISHMQSGDYIKRAFSRDPLGNILGWIDPYQGAESFTYDDLSRITSATGPGYGGLGWSYDLAGNRLSETRLADAATFYAYEPASNRLESISGVRNADFAHNARGDITRINDLELSYDAAGRMRAAVDDGETIAEYAYDNRFRRTAKHLPSQSRYFAYDRGDRLLAEFVGSSRTATNVWPLIDYIYLGTERVARISPALPTYAASSPSLELAFVSYFHNDHLGTPLVTSDEFGDSLWFVDRDPFGQRHDDFFFLQSQPLDMPGQYWDGETGLSYNWNRYYDATTGRFLAEDPIKSQWAPNPTLTDAIGLKLLNESGYSYVFNSPLMLWDPTGLAPCFIVCVNALAGAASECFKYEFDKSCFLNTKVTRLGFFTNVTRLGPSITPHSCDNFRGTPYNPFPGPGPI